MSLQELKKLPRTLVQSAQLVGYHFMVAFLVVQLGFPQYAAYAGPKDGDTATTTTATQPATTPKAGVPGAEGVIDNAGFLRIQGLRDRGLDSSVTPLGREESPVTVPEAWSSHAIMVEIGQRGDLNTLELSLEGAPFIHEILMPGATKVASHSTDGNHLVLTLSDGTKHAIDLGRARQSIYRSPIPVISLGIGTEIPREAVQKAIDAQTPVLDKVASGDISGAVTALSTLGLGFDVVQLSEGLTSGETEALKAHVQKVESFFRSLQTSTLPQTHGEERKALFNGRQVREDYETVNGVTRTVGQHVLKGTDVTRAHVDYFPNEIRVAYSAENQRLEFQRWVYNDALKKPVKVNAHLFYGVKLTGNAANCVVRDGNITLISTSDWGVLGGFSPVILSSLFNSFVPLTTFYPAASAVDPNATVEKLELLTPGSKPRDVFDTQGNLIGKYATDALVIQLRSGNRSYPIHFNYRGDLMARLRAHILSVMLLMQAANPKLELLPKIAAILKAERARRGAIDQASDELATIAADSGDHLTMATLRHAAHTVDFGKLAGLLEPDKEGNTAFERLQAAPSVEWTARDWPRLHALIEESREAEQAEAERHGLPPDRLARSWGEILAANIRNPNQTVTQKVAEIAQKRATASDSLTGDLKNLAKDQLTPLRLTVLGSAVAADLANKATGGQVTSALFSTISSLLGWTTQTWGLSSLVTETAQYSGNYYQSYAFTSTALLLGVLLTFQPLCYVVAKTVALVRGERNEDGTAWTSAQAFFSYGGRMYAYLTYPFQLLLWRMAGQKNITTALKNGGGLTTPGALHIPFSDASAEAAKERMSTFIDSDALRKQRAMLIAALSVSEVLKADHGSSIDPATLMMLMEAHEAGQMEKFNQVLSELPPNAAWSAIAANVYKELTKMRDGGVGVIDEKSVNKYAQVMSAAVKQFADMNTPKTGLAACVKGAATASCKWVADKGKKFGVWTSEIVGTLLTGGTSFRFFERNKDFVANTHNTAVADHQFKQDYAGSEQMTALTDSQRFPVALQLGHLDKIAAAIADATEQCLVYGAQGGIEQSMINNIGADLQNSSPTLAALALRRDHLPTLPHGESHDYELGTGSQATVAQSLVTMGAALGDTEAGIPQLLHTQVRRMDATVQALQGKSLMGYVPRVVALMMISAIVAAQSSEGITSWSGTDMAHTAGGALLRQANVIFNKLSLVYGAGGFALGYAIVWAPVIWLQNTLQNAVNANISRINKADHLIEQGMRNDEETAWRAGVEGLLALYSTGKKRLPAEFVVPVKDYSADLARKLALYSQKNPPIATVISQKASWFNNVALGAFVSTILAMTLSHSMYDASVPIMPQLTGSIAAFTATYFGVKTLKAAYAPVVNFVAAIPGAIVDGCAKAVSAFTGRGGNGGSGGNYNPSEAETDSH